jgi:phosphonoacetate hydrolase
VRAREPANDRRYALGSTSSPGSTLRINDRDYRWPTKPAVVVCLDGSPFEYLRQAIAAGVAPYLESLVARGFVRMADAAMPTFTNPNNLSIVTGVPPARHGISGNFFLDRETGEAVMMNDASFLRAETIPAVFSRAGAMVVVMTAKDKLRNLLGAGLRGVCLSAEQEGQPVYSALLSEHVLRRGVELMRSMTPDMMYLSTSDYVQHTHAPGSPEADRFYGVIDGHLAELDRLGATLVITADHGMQAKADAQGRPRVVYVQTLLDDWFGRDTTRVILPITDPYVAHHGSLGSFATAYAANESDVVAIIERLSAVPGVDMVLAREDACRQFELPEDRIGDVVICADCDTVLGTRPADHDLSVLSAPLRSHGGLAEREVPMLFNQTPPDVESAGRLRNYDAFWIILNGNWPLTA